MALLGEHLKSVRKGSFVVKEDSLTNLESSHRAANPSNDTSTFETKQVLIFGNDAHGDRNILFQD